MLIRLDNPNLVINAQEFPQHVVLMTHRRVGVSEGGVSIQYLSDFANNVVERRDLEYTRAFSALTLDHTPDFFEYVLPFWELHDTHGRRGSTFGFTIEAHSAYCANRGAGIYAERDTRFTMHFPVTGGGIIRFASGVFVWDLSNPTFNPRAPIPAINASYGAGAGDEYVSGPPGIDNQRVPDAVIINAYRRVHMQSPAADAAAARRAARLANPAIQLIPETTTPQSREADQVAQEQQLPTPVVTPKRRRGRFAHIDDE